MTIPSLEVQNLTMKFTRIEVDRRKFVSTIICACEKNIKKYGTLIVLHKFIFIFTEYELRSNGIILL